ncbi:MAG: division/cell wall cluster transcriptional repressor MraZ [Bacteroidetes bacterium]|jgi:MraZ protein|nr:division/cell wall cluster transcriptional repressor MraZ [Bacteroidota bacterium]
MAHFIGEHSAKIDSKGRVLFPASFRKQLAGEGQEEFVLNRGFERCLVLYPRKEWDAISAQLAKLNPFKKENRLFVRQFNNGAMPITLDSAGRMLIGKDLLGYAGISSDMIFAANGNKIELWSKADYEEMMQIDSDAFADLAERVMGGDLNASEE